MEEGTEICSLDYLMGTLATGYKGLITGLIAKDFCISEEGKGAVVKGTILSMPQGTYRASLMRQGRELSRAEIQDGFFELRVDSGLIRSATNLQVDIIQNGRHIGTFLLKSGKTDTLFSPALELSEELRGIDFTRLTSYLRDRVGLLRSAEDIITKLVSTKKDWRKLSGDIMSFSKDLFWVARPAYYGWYVLFVRYSRKACERVDAASRDKPISNFLSLIELPLVEESDQNRLQELAATWLGELAGSSINLSRHGRQVIGILRSVHEKLPDAEIRPVIRRLIVALKTRIMENPTISDAVVNSMRDVISVTDRDLLSRYREERKGDMLRILSPVEALAEGEGYGEVLDKIGIVDSMLPDDSEMIDTLSTLIETNLTEESVPRFLEVLRETFALLERLSPDGQKRMVVNMARLIAKMIRGRMIGPSETLLTYFESGPISSREEIIMNPDVAGAILRAGDDALIQRYTGMLKRIVIPIPSVAGFSNETWAELVNPSHLERLSKFLAIIRLDSNRFQEILVHVICNLYVSGVFIPDDKLFQREVSSYLNGETVRDNFLLHYLLLQKLPVYYHDVGAAGRLRDYTTEIDAWGNDPVLYFLRKQVHVNASNYNISLVEAIMKAWALKDPEILRGFVPGDVFDKVNTDLLSPYAAVLSPFFRSLGILDERGAHFEKILSLPEGDLERPLKDAGTAEEIRSKIMLLFRIYQEVVKKYALIGGPVQAKDRYRNLSHGIERARSLKAIFLSSEKSLPEETLYFKRHIAFGIPSVMGTYHERKFDALGELLRNEEEIRVIFEDVISEIEARGKDFSFDDMRNWISCLEAMHELFDLHGLGNFQVDELLTILRTNTLHLSEIIDMLRIWQRELTWMVESLSGTFHGPIGNILKSFPEDELPRHLKRFSLEGKDFVNKATDVIIRDMVNSIAGFVELDRALYSIIEALTARVDSGSDIEFRPEGGTETTDDYFTFDLLSDADAMRLSPQIGGKAKNLIYLRNRGIRVPHGVVFSSRHTENYRNYLEDSDFSESLTAAVRELETRTGNVFGGYERPLFLSVRSGSYVSMPGILSSILYCGMNGKTVSALIEEKDNPLLGWDSYRRFIEHYSTIVYGLDAVFFEDRYNTYLKALGIGEREEPAGEEMKQVVNLYLTELAENGFEIPEDVYEQLRESVKAIYRSWFSDKAEQFRKAMHVSRHWGTAVILMEMIYGNDRGSGTSVFFTRNPFTRRRNVYGDTKERATGGDLVYGKHTNRPLSREQGSGNEKSLEDLDPPLYSLHERLGERIEEVMGVLPQEVEATYTKRSDGERIIYVLQTRRMELHRGFTKRFHDVCRMESKIIGHGVGVHGGALSGVATLSSSKNRIMGLRQKFNLPVILLRKSASPDDVSLMPDIDGILTAAGGVASHASVLAQKFDLAAVVGCSDMNIRTDEQGKAFAQIGNVQVTDGTLISIDGSTGLVYAGLCMLTVEREGR
ncbi:MAG TPA: PEP/pyruvate-binding domain-containing protein [Thermodesulfovibrionales bacterium]|nr:PEP/pyruvate-binding domain-containing protein [Thermodesulfovibrionales bacterium]